MQQAEVPALVAAEQRLSTAAAAASAAHATSREMTAAWQLHQFLSSSSKTSSHAPLVLTLPDAPPVAAAGSAALAAAHDVVMMSSLPSPIGGISRGAATAGTNSHHHHSGSLAAEVYGGIMMQHHDDDGDEVAAAAAACMHHPAYDMMAMPPVSPTELLNLSPCSGAAEEAAHFFRLSDIMGPATCGGQTTSTAATAAAAAAVEVPTLLPPGGLIWAGSDAEEEAAALGSPLRQTRSQYEAAGDLSSSCRVLPCQAATAAMGNAEEFAVHHDDRDDDGSSGIQGLGARSKPAEDIMCEPSAAATAAAAAELGTAASSFFNHHHPLHRHVAVTPPLMADDGLLRDTPSEAAPSSAHLPDIMVLPNAAAPNHDIIQLLDDNDAHGIHHASSEPAMAGVARLSTMMMVAQPHAAISRSEDLMMGTMMRRRPSSAEGLGGRSSRADAATTSGQLPDAHASWPMLNVRRRSKVTFQECRERSPEWHEEEDAGHFPAAGFTRASTVHTAGAVGVGRGSRDSSARRGLPAGGGLKRHHSHGVLRSAVSSSSSKGQQTALCASAAAIASAAAAAAAAVAMDGDSRGHKEEQQMNEEFQRAVCDGEYFSTTDMELKDWLRKQQRWTELSDLTQSGEPTFVGKSADNLKDAAPAAAAVTKSPQHRGIALHNSAPIQLCTAAAGGRGRGPAAAADVIEGCIATRASSWPPAIRGAADASAKMMQQVAGPPPAGATGAAAAAAACSGYGRDAVSSAPPLGHLLPHVNAMQMMRGGRSFSPMEQGLALPAAGSGGGRHLPWSVLGGGGGRRTAGGDDADCMALIAPFLHGPATMASSSYEEATSAMSILMKGSNEDDGGRGQSEMVMGSQAVVADVESDESAVRRQHHEQQLLTGHSVEEGNHDAVLLPLDDEQLLLDDIMMMSDLQSQQGDAELQGMEQQQHRRHVKQEPDQDLLMQVSSGGGRCPAAAAEAAAAEGGQMQAAGSSHDMEWMAGVDPVGERGDVKKRQKQETGWSGASGGGARLQLASRAETKASRESRRRKRLSDCLQQLREVVKSPGDNARVLETAVDYIRKLQKHAAALEEAIARQGESPIGSSNEDGINVATNGKSATK